MISAKQTVKNKVFVFSIKYRNSDSDIFIEKYINFIILLIRLFELSEKSILRGYHPDAAVLFFLTPALANRKEHFRI